MFGDAAADNDTTICSLFATCLLAPASLPYRITDCLFLLSPLVHANLCTCSTSVASGSCSRSPPTSGNDPKNWARGANGRLHSGLVSTNRAERHTSCSHSFKTECALEDERNIFQAPPQLCSLLYFRFHHRMDLHMTTDMLLLFLLHDLLRDLHSRLEVPKDLHLIRLSTLLQDESLSLVPSFSKSMRPRRSTCGRTLHQTQLWGDITWKKEGVTLKPEEHKNQ